MTDLNNLIDNSEINEMMEILEQLEDEVLAVELLKELNTATSNLGKLLVNQDQELNHGEWKVQCDDAKKAVDSVVMKIKNL